MSTPGYQAPNPQQDPTAVMGSRSVAWLVDAVLLGVILLFFLPTPLSPLATEFPGADDVEDACQVLRDSEDDVGMCFKIGDKAYTTEGAAVVLQGAVYLAYFLVVQVVWQGYTGMTPGKALLGLRTVGEDGQSPGMSKALVRSFLWIVDGQPAGIPLVGFFCGVATTGHRRVGDMAAKTYVVAKADAGKPIVVPGMTPSYGVSAPTYAGYGATGYQGQTTASPWTGQAASPVAGTPSPTWGQQSTGYPTQPPTAAEPQGYGTATPSAYQQPASPYGGMPAQPSSTEPASPYGTPAQPSSEQPASPYGGMPAQPSSTEPASPYGTPAQPSSTEPASPYGTPAQPSSTEPTPAEPTAPGPTSPESATSSDRPVTWPPVVSSPESIGMPSADESSSSSWAATPPGTEEPRPEAAPESPASEPAESPWANLGGAFSQPSAPEPTSEPAASEPEPTPEPPATEPRSAASELADLLGSSGAEEQSPPSAPAPTTDAESGAGYKPQWDAARGAYIQWDPNRQSWLQWDDTAKEWKAI